MGKGSRTHMTDADAGRDRYGGCLLIESDATGFFRVEEIDGWWWFITPEGHGLVSMGMNHFDLAVLKHTDNIHVWRGRYGGSEDRYIREGIAQPLKEWGFNTIGWTEESVGGEWGNDRAPIRHSPEWTARQFRIADMPYCHSLHFADIEDFNSVPHYPDVSSDDFALWADYVARRSCVAMADDPMLIGYTLCPRPAFERRCRGSWADGLDLEKLADRQALADIVRRFYRIVSQSVRRYDPNHLIFGHRFGAPPDTPAWPLKIAADFVDVLCANWWMPSIASAQETLGRWYELTGKPILISDSAFLAPTELLGTPGGPCSTPSQAERGRAYQRFATEVASCPYLVGWHWCAFIENRARKSGIKNYLDEPYHDCVSRMAEFNRERLYSTRLAAQSP